MSNELPRLEKDEQQQPPRLHTSSAAFELVGLTRRRKRGHKRHHNGLPSVDAGDDEGRGERRRMGGGVIGVFSAEKEVERTRVDITSHYLPSGREGGAVAKNNKQKKKGGG